MVGNHGWMFAFCAVKFHDQKPAVVVVTFQKSPDKLRCFFRIDDGIKRMQGPESIPKREVRVIVEIGGRVHFPIGTPEFPVNIHENIRMDHRMIERGIKEDFFGLRSTCHLNFRKFLIPVCTCIFFYLSKIPVRHFRFQIFACTIDAHHRNTNFQQNWLIRFGIETEKSLDIFRFNRIRNAYNQIILSHFTTF